MLEAKNVKFEVHQKKKIIGKVEMAITCLTEIILISQKSRHYARERGPLGEGSSGLLSREC